MLQNFCDWLSETPPSLLIQQVSWVIPTTQSIHILSIAVVMSCVTMFDLRLMGISGRRYSIRTAANRLLPAVWWALIVLACTGTILVIGEPARELINVMFRLKLILLAIVVAITLFLERRIRRDATYWDDHKTAARVTAVASLALWLAILSAGRWIGYTEHG